jgi:hypothetical protein
MGSTLLLAGDIAASRTHFDRAVALYDPTEHRRLVARFGHDIHVMILCYRSWAGASAMRVPRSLTPTKRSVMREKLATLRL